MLSQKPTLPPCGAHVKRMQSPSGHAVLRARCLPFTSVGRGVWKPKKGALRSLSSEKRLRREQDVQLPVIVWVDIDRRR